MDTSKLETHSPNSRYLFTLTLGALGVVFGDIGTSPLYAIRECFHSIPVTTENVLGILSLVFWALLIVISGKYVLYVMRADNRGEGGVLALMALAHPKPELEGRDPKRFVIYLGLFGSALLYGDGVITPAISVLSAVEGLEIATPYFKSYVVPISVAILIFLFTLQRFGTDKIGKAFGPIILIWFFVLAILGLNGIIHNPNVLEAINPYHAFNFMMVNRLEGFFTLGVVFLVVTGGEALYADIGHFGRKPINLAWFFVVLPSLMLNYFGQGALLLKEPAAQEHPFYHLAPSWATLPLVGLSAIAAIIASQALISGTFSMTRQAIQLGYLPRQKINHTSHSEIGQIYLPSINWTMLFSTVVLVLVFNSSSNLAAAYGLAVTATMVITTILIYFVARDVWRWPQWLALTISLFFGIIDISFFASNLVKLFEGGFVPIVLGGFIFACTTTWRRGRHILANRLRSRTVKVEKFLAQLEHTEVHIVPGTAIFMTSVPEGTPPSLIHNVRHNHVLHENTVLLTVTTQSVPHVESSDNLEVKQIHKGIYSVMLRYGFMDVPDVPRAMQQAFDRFFAYDAQDVTYFLGRETLISTSRPGMARWREKLFSFMTKNSQKATDFFKLPADRVFEIGMVVEL